MIPLASATCIFVVTGATDMRKGFYGLYGIVANHLGMDPTSGHLFVFCNATRTRIKVLTWDGLGLWLCNKRLEQGRFRWDWDASQSSATIPHEQLAMLLEKGSEKGSEKKGQAPNFVFHVPFHREKGAERISYSERHNIRSSSSTSELLSEAPIQTLMRTCELAPKRCPRFASINGRQSTRASAMFSARLPTLPPHGSRFREAGL
jgi:transposase